jgi:Rod binding domain-containing protein
MDVWRSQQVQEYGKAIAQNGGVGIADAVVRELIQAQEARS